MVNQLAVYFDRVSNATQEAGVGVGGNRLLVTASARGDIRLSVALLEQRRPRLSSFIRQGELRLADHLKRLLALPPPLERQPQVDIPITQLNGHASSEDEEEVIRVVMLVPDEWSFRLDDHHIVPVELRHNPLSASNG